MLTTEKFDETSNEENNVALSGTPEDTMSSNVEETEKRVLRKRKKTTQEFVCKFEDFAHTIGKSTNSSGEGIKKKLHYSKFEFHSIQYGLEDYVVLLAEDTYDNNHVAIIKDIYVQGNKLGHVYLDVQWFYRPQDVHKSYLKDWKQRDSRELFASFHRDEKVSAESVMNGCDVYFLTKYINVPNREEHSSYVVQHAYNHLTSKMWSFADVNNGYFLDEEEREIRRLISKTSSLLGLDFHHDDDDDEEDIVESSNAQEMLIIEKELAAADERAVVKRSIVANEPYYKSILDNQRCPNIFAPSAIHIDGMIVAAMHVLVPKSERMYNVIMERILEMGLPMIEPYQWYIDDCRHGTMKHCGFRLVLERMMLFATVKT
ncbi:unnamed protein product [Cochlearia groenlandica]